MTKTDIIAKAAEAAKISKSAATTAINTVFDSIVEALAANDKVQISGFGTFEVRTRKARTGVKPGTKEKIEIPEKQAPAFSPAKAFKEAVNS